MTLCMLLGQDYGKKVSNINIRDTYEQLPPEYTYAVIMRNISDAAQYVEVEPAAHTLVVFKVMGKISHVGYMINDKEFVHILAGRNVALEKISSPTWRNRVVGYYKYVGEDNE